MKRFSLFCEIKSERKSESTFFKSCCSKISKLMKHPSHLDATGAERPCHYQVISHMDAFMFPKSGLYSLY